VFIDEIDAIGTKRFDRYVFYDIFSSCMVLFLFCLMILYEKKMLIACIGSKYFLFQFSVNKSFLLGRSLHDVCFIILFFWYSEVSGDREVQQKMLELLNQLAAFNHVEMIMVIAATNRADILDTSLLKLFAKINVPL
jgi:SpoVK/Ycf46/Vps4 family AAA+-type ATPase